MAHQAFALSPITARANLPSEEDYEAIREAFMETARGRWFLDEYAKRNRNADTRMVLDAVARIEETLAAQRQPPPPDNRLGEALAGSIGAIEHVGAHPRGEVIDGGRDRWAESLAKGEDFALHAVQNQEPGQPGQDAAQLDSRA